MADTSGGDFAVTGTPWYLVKRKDAATVSQRLNAQVSKIWWLDGPRLDRYEKYYRLYGGARLLSIRPWDMPTDINTAPSQNSVIEDALRLNVVKASIDTVTSKVGKARPRPTFQVNGGDFKARQRAKLLQKFADGAYHTTDAYELGAQMFRDGMIFGTGVMHPYGAAGRMCAERVFPWEMFVDPADALYGTPRCLYRIKYIDYDIARSRYGYDPTDLSREAMGYDDYHKGFARIVEGWCLPVPKYGSTDVEPGRHVMVIGDKVICDEEWDSPTFPFVFFHWSLPIQGFWGDSAVREVAGIQIEINSLIQSIQDSMTKVGKPFVFKMDDVIVSPANIGNIPAQFINVDPKSLGGRSVDEALKVVTFQPAHPTVIQHVWSLYSKAFEILGSNQLAASATAPAGLESGRALEQLSDEHSERFMTVSRHYEWVMGKALVVQMMRVAEELDDIVPGGFSLNAPGQRDNLRIKWREVVMDPDSYTHQVFPTSVLPTTPGARIEEVQRLSDAQWIDRETAMRLLQLPDLQSENDLVSADADLLDRQLSEMLEDGTPHTPYPYQNLKRAAVRTQQAIMRGQADGVPEAHLDCARDFLAMVEALAPAAPAEPTPDQGSALQPQPNDVAPAAPAPGSPPAAVPPTPGA